MRSLAADELERLISTTIESPDLCHVRDMFVFACFTDISYIDLKNLTWKEIITEEDGSRWISKSRQKTGVPFNVRLLDIPVRIIEKYRAFSRGNLVFDLFCQTKTNQLLKEIAGLCGVDRVLTFHLARHSFATSVCLTNGIPIESLSQMMGHLSIKTTQIYAKVTRIPLSKNQNRKSKTYFIQQQSVVS
jgi:integrase